MSTIRSRSRQKKKPTWWRKYHDHTVADFRDPAVAVDQGFFLRLGDRAGKFRQDETDRQSAPGAPWFEGSTRIVQVAGRDAWHHPGGHQYRHGRAHHAYYSPVYQPVR